MTCPHGLVGFCPDCPPGSFTLGGDYVGVPSARLKGRDGFFHVVERVKADGAFDWFTYHWTRWGARRAVKAYMRDGTVKGHRP